MKKAFLSAIMLFCASGIIHAQDRITTKDGIDIQAKILEITDSEVKYKKFSNLEGPTYTINKENILIVRYANGENEIFKSTKPQAPTKTEQQYSSQRRPNTPPRRHQSKPDIQQHPKKEPITPKPKKEYEQRKFALGTGSVEHYLGEDNITTAAFGARFGIMKLFGVYAGAEVGIGGFPFYDYEEIEHSQLENGYSVLVKRQDPRLNLAFGGLLRINKASTLYLGGGWTFGQTLFCGQNGVWYKLDDSLSFPIIEAGALFHIKKFNIMIGGAFISDEWIGNYDRYGKISFGVGYNF